MAENTYEVYKRTCIAEGAPPLTRREWEAEGGLTYYESLRKTRRYQQEQSDKWMQQIGWI